MSYSLHQEEQKKQQDTTLEQACGGVADAPKVKLSTKKLLKGHINKVNSVHYSGDNRLVLVSKACFTRSVIRRTFYIMIFYFFKCFLHITQDMKL